MCFSYILGTFLWKEHHTMYVMEKYIGNNITICIHFSFFHFYCELNFLKMSIFTYFPHFNAYINLIGLKAYIYILGQHSNIIFGQDVFTPKVAEFKKIGGTLAVICSCVSSYGTSLISTSFLSALVGNSCHWSPLWNLPQNHNLQPLMGGFEIRIDIIAEYKLNRYFRNA